jgi:mRNA-degrading endonuclease RelE of RelBE toxin-antitoxin system
VSLCYRWMLDEEPYGFLRRLPRGRRLIIERALDRLGLNPFTEPSFIAFDADGEEVFHLFVSGHVIVYHVDHAVRRILVYEIYRVR